MNNLNMVDFQRKNRNKVIKLEQIIADLKQQPQRDQNDNYRRNQLIETELCGNKNNARDISRCFGEVSKKNKSGSQNTQSNITDYFAVVKTKPVSSSIRDITIWSVLDTLKASKESCLVTAFEDEGSKYNTDTSIDINNYQTQSHSSNRGSDVNFSNSSGCRFINDKNESDRQLNTSTEVTRKTHNSHKRQINKRMKICSDTNQSSVTDFFNLNHRFCSNNSENDTASGTIVEENFVGNTTFDNMSVCFDTPVKESITENDKKCKLVGNSQLPMNKEPIRKPELKSPPRKVDTNSSRGSHNDLLSKEKNEKPLNVFRSFKIEDKQDSCTKRIHGNNSDMDVRKKVIFHNKEPVRKEQNQTTFDDFCNNVVTIIGQNSNENKKMETEKDKEKLQYIHSATNFFPKSRSTGTLIVKTQTNSCKDRSSLPVTDMEIKSRKDKLRPGKISFDDFIQDILKDLSGSESDKKDYESNIESIHNPEEKNNVNNESQKNNIKDLIGSLENDKQVKSTVMNNTSKLNLSKCHRKKLYQSDHETIPQKSNSTDPGFFLTRTENNLENFELFSTTNYSEICNDDTNRKENDLKHNVILAQCSESKGSESEDFLSYFPKNWNASSQFLKEPAQLLLTEEENLTKTNCNKHNDYAFPSLEHFPVDICKEISLEVPQDDPNAVQATKLINEKEISYKDDSCPTHRTCIEYPNFTKSNTYHIDSNNQYVENASEQEPLYNVWNDNLLENNLVNILVSKCDQVKNNTKQSEDNKTEKFDDFLEKLLKQNTLKHDTNRGENKVVPKRTYIKRFRKGKTKIYRLKKLTKTCPKSDIVKADHEENLNFDDIFKKITQDVCTKDLKRSKSMSSVSTSSSYVTDVTRSEILSTGSNELSSPKQRLRKGFNELSKNKSLLYCEEQWENTTEYDKEEIKMKIQDIILKVVEDFSEKNSCSLKYRRQSYDNCIFKDGRLQLKPMAESSMTVINSKAQRSQSKFNLICYLLKKIQNLLETDTKLTKRELYYQLKTLIKDQQVTDRAINTISCLLDVGMWALNIVAQKGLVFGNLKILMSSGETLNCNIPGTLIPQDINDIVEIASPAYFILVVEKESIFYKLIEEDLPNRLTRPFIMITGKGFPDLNTQLFLKKLWMIMSVPVFILVDADPHGINIMLNYRFGSVKNAHVSHQLAVPNAKWLGVYPSEVINLNITRELLSERELKLVNQLLKTPYMDCNPKIVDELKVLLETKSKAEIEGLIKSDTYLSEVYLPNKFFTHNFI